MKVLFISHTPMGGPFVVGSHQLARAMIKLGHNVLHISPPITPAHLILIRNSFERERFKRWFRYGQKIDGVSDVVPASLISWGLARRMGSAFHVFGRGVQAAAEKLFDFYDFRRPDIVFIDEPRLGYLLTLIRSNRVIYRPTDIYAELRNDASILDAEREVISRSHAFIATSQPVAEHLYSLGVKSLLLMENGVEIEHFIDGPSFDIEVNLPPKPRAIYAGALDERFGVDAIASAACQNQDVSFILIGPAKTHVQTQLKAHPNIHFLGAVPYERLPSYLRCSQIGLLPLSAHASNQGRSPMKLFEYAAAGLSVVSTATDELRRRHLPFVHLANSSEDFARLVTHAIQVEFPKQDCIQVANQHSWRAKARAAIEYAKHLGI